MSVQRLAVCAWAALFAFSADMCAQQSQCGPAQSPEILANAKSSQRVIGIIPAFNSSDDANAPALSPSKKFHLFAKTVSDPFTLVMPAVNAVILDSAGASSGYGTGFSGAAKRYGSSLADTTSGNFFRLYAFPALLHEDPRYFRGGSGPISKRTKHAIGAVFRTRKDDPTFRFNWSKLLASASSASLSNAYYPEENRGAALTLDRIALSYVTEMGTNALKEFWPDIAQKLHKKRH